MSKVPINYMIYTNVVFGARLCKDAQEGKKKKKTDFADLSLKACKLFLQSYSY